MTVFDISPINSKSFLGSQSPLGSVLTNFIFLEIFSVYLNFQFTCIELNKVMPRVSFDSLYYLLLSTSGPPTIVIISCLHILHFFLIILSVGLYLLLSSFSFNSHLLDLFCSSVLLTLLINLSCPCKKKKKKLLLSFFANAPFLTF